MRRPHPMALAAALALALAACTPAAPAQGRDACLVGSWSPIGNGAAEWLQRQAPGIKMAVTRQVATLVLAADGSYREQTHIQARATSPDGGSARSDAHSSAQGEWSSEADKLKLAPTGSDMGGTVKPDVGPTFVIPESPVQTTTQTYTCGDDELETRLQIPGIDDPIVQRYRRE